MLDLGKNHKLLVLTIFGAFTFLSILIAVAPATTSPLEQGVVDATKDFPGIKATVADSVITVTGEIAQSKVKTLKQSLDALNPKKVDMSQVKVK